METPDQRRSRLVAHAAKMRAARGKKTTILHSTGLSLQLERTTRLMNRLAPDNMAPMPMAMALEGNTWTVDLHIRTRDKEFEGNAEAKELEDALASARRGLQNYENLHHENPEGAKP